jgi:hypothetical protein
VAMGESVRCTDDERSRKRNIYSLPVRHFDFGGHEPRIIVTRSERLRIQYPQEAYADARDHIATREARGRHAASPTAPHRIGKLPDIMLERAGGDVFEDEHIACGDERRQRLQVQSAGDKYRENCHGSPWIC